MGVRAGPPSPPLLDPSLAGRMWAVLCLPGQSQVPPPPLVPCPRVRCLKWRQGGGPELNVWSPLPERRWWCSEGCSDGRRPRVPAVWWGWAGMAPGSTRPFCL